MGLQTLNRWVRVCGLLLCVCVSHVLALDSRIREAAYLFEFEGRVQSALQLLKEVQQSGSMEDRDAATFYLAKIADFQGDTATAIHSLRSFISSNAASNEMTDWAASRLADLDPNPTQLVTGTMRLPAAIQERIPGRAPLIQLVNRTLWKPDGVHLTRLRVDLPKDFRPIEAGPTAVWGISNETNQIEEFSLLENSVRSSIHLDSKILHSFHLENGEWFVQTHKSVQLFRNAKVVWTKDNKYPDCEPLAQVTSSQQILLNCPDNALHTLSLHDGQEGNSISLFDPIDTVLTSPDGIWVANNASIWFYRLNRNQQPIWQQNFHSVQSILLLENTLWILEGDGSLNILQANTGGLISRTRTEPGTLFPVGHRVGLISRDGNLEILDPSGQLLWQYQAGQAPATLPMVGENALFLTVGNNQVFALDARYFGVPKSDLQVKEESLERLISLARWDSLRLLTDTLLRLEPGNALAWASRARYYSEFTNQADTALYFWSKAAQHSRHLSSTLQQQILKPYVRKLGATWIQFLPSSSQTYPKLFGGGRDLFTIDAGNRSLVSMDPYTGQFRWRTSTQALDQGFVAENDGRYLAIASGFDVSIHDLSQQGRLVTTLSLPGKAFQIKFSRNALYLSTWNGFILRFQKKGFESSWSRKVFNTGSYLAPEDDILHVLSLDGDVQNLTAESGASHAHAQPFNASASDVQLADTSLLAVSQEGVISCLGSQSLQPLWEISLETQVFSIQSTDVNGQRSILLGLSDQRLVMLSIKTGKEIWSYQGKGSVYIHPNIQGSQVLIDQGTSILSLELSTGKPITRINVPDGAGSIWANSSTLFTSSPQGLLFAFPLPR